MSFPSIAAANKHPKKDLLAILAGSDVVARNGLGADVDAATARLADEKHTDFVDLHSRLTAIRAAETIRVERAHVGARGMDLPSIDLQKRSLDDQGKSFDAPPYIQRAMLRATKQVRRCYGRELAKRPGLSGRLVAHFVIAGDGEVSQVLIVESNLTESMGKCVRRILGKLQWRNPSGEPIEVTAPWTFAAPR